MIQLCYPNPPDSAIQGPMPGEMDSLCGKVDGLSRPLKVTDSNRTLLAYYIIYPFSVHYKRVMFYSTGCRAMLDTELFNTIL
jgi:hypothetical protein